MVQNGADNEGMLGFLLPDIEKVLTRSINDICQYCQKGHATIKCCKGKCRMMYHQPCGLENGSLFQFFGSFKNFCPRHKPVQNIPKNIFCSVKKSRTICSICYTTINLKKLNDILWAPCCKKTWYHKYCIQVSC